jgi:hypothetical protein
MKTIKLEAGDAIPTGDGVRFVVCAPVMIVCRTDEGEKEKVLIRMAREIHNQANRKNEHHRRHRLAQEKRQG